MSVQRSPPGQLNAPVTTTHYNSDSAINNSSNIDEHYFNITKRQKRTFDELAVHPGSPLSEIKLIVSEIKDQHESKFDMLASALTTVISQNQDILTSVARLTSQNEELQAEMKILKQENTEYRQRVTKLEKQLDHQEKKSLCTTIEIRNLPKLANTNKSSLMDVLKNIGLAIGLDSQIPNSEIRDIYRGKSEGIIVDFTTSLRQESVIAKFRAFNKSKREKGEETLNSEHIGVPGTARTLYMSEYLTSKMRRVFHMAREHVKNKNLTSAWTAHGNVYIKKHVTGTPIRIYEESDFDNITL